MERITRDKVYAMTYWKEKCFAVSAEALVDLAVDLRACGGIYGGNNRATEFLCLTLKLLQIQPDKEIILEFIKNEDHKYVRLLGAFYMRLVGKPTDVYRYLEPLLNDYRKVRYRSKDGKYALTHVDEFVNNLLTKDQFCDVSLPRIPHRQVLEATGALELRVSALEEDIADLEEQLEQAVDEAFKREMKLDEDEEPSGAGRDVNLAAAQPANAASAKRRREDGELDEVAPALEFDHKRNGRREPDVDRQYRSRSRSQSPHRRRDRSRDRGGDGDRRHRDAARRSRSRSRSRSPRWRRDSRDRDRRFMSERIVRDPFHADHASKEKKENKEKKGNKDKSPTVDPEIAEANAIRAKLGLKPLK